MNKPQANRIVIEYVDGSCDFADGDAARQIKEWMDSAEAMLCIHGGVYRGPKFEHIAAPSRPAPTPADQPKDRDR